MKNPAAVVFTDAELHRQFKVRCAAEGQAMTAVVQALVRGWLEADAAVEHVPVVTARPVTKATTDAVCRCGHPRAAHWVKGCLVGCSCAESRYRPRDPGTGASDAA